MVKLKNMRTNKKGLKKEIKELKKAIFMKCLDCTCFQPKEIINCEISSCPLWKNRPREAKGLYILSKELKGKKDENFEAKK